MSAATPVHPDSCPCLLAKAERAEAAARDWQAIAESRARELSEAHAEYSALTERLVRLERSLAELVEVREERDEALEALEVAHEIGDTFWAALKPLNLQAINVANPGQHVTDVIRERDEWRNVASRHAATLIQAEENWRRQSLELAGLGSINAELVAESARQSERLADLSMAIAETIADCGGCGGDGLDGGGDAPGPCLSCAILRSALPDWKGHLEPPAPDPPPELGRAVAVANAAVLRPAEPTLTETMAELRDLVGHHFDGVDPIEYVDELRGDAPAPAAALSEQELSRLADALYLVHRDASEHPWKRVAEAAAKAVLAARPPAPDPAALVERRTAEECARIVEERQGWCKDDIAAAIRERFAPSGREKGSGKT